MVLSRSSHSPGAICPFFRLTLDEDDNQKRALYFALSLSPMSSNDGASSYRGQYIPTPCDHFLTVPEVCTTRDPSV